MKVKISKLRYRNILPSSLLSEMSKKSFSGITINNNKFYKEDKWWKYEEYLDIHFDTNVTDDITKDYSKLCSICEGECCKDLPTHNIGMYMSEYEISKAKEKDYLLGKIKIEKQNFGIIKVKDNGDCYFLRENGCKLKDDKPLWCKLWVCKKLHDKIKNGK